MSNVLTSLQPNIWCVAKARYLFDVAVERAWDCEHGGLAYSFAPSGAPCDWDKIFWVHCESIGTAAMLATVTGDDKYWTDYERDAILHGIQSQITNRKLFFKTGYGIIRGRSSSTTSMALGVGD